MFHEYRDIMTELKAKDAHFHKMFTKHNELDDEIEKMEQGYVDQFEIEVKKKEKLKLKDELYDQIIKYKNSK